MTFMKALKLKQINFPCTKRRLIFEYKTLRLMFISSWLLKSKGQFPFNIQKRNEPCDSALI